MEVWSEKADIFFFFFLFAFKSVFGEVLMQSRSSKL